MLSAIGKNDLDKLRELITESVRGSINCSGEEAAVLIDDIVQSLENWSESGSLGFHRKYSVADEVVGFVVVKDYWKLSHLFVSPEFQGRGIGRSLVEQIIADARTYFYLLTLRTFDDEADHFYRALGFVTEPKLESVSHHMQFKIEKSV